MSPGFTIYEAGTSLDWDGDTKVFLVLFNFANNDIILCWVHPPMFVLGVMKRQIVSKSISDLSRISRLVYITLIINM